MDLATIRPSGSHMTGSPLGILESFGNFLISLGPGGEATLGTCWGIAFYRSEAGHYRVPVLHVAFCRKPLSDLEGAGVGENPSARLCYSPRLEK
ncbi:hypothetical protein F2Q70_00016823 [Brassica cretica]|nr:hypothetical protein F2Q70_00016823 [Brassica cretica]